MSEPDAAPVAVPRLPLLQRAHATIWAAPIVVMAWVAVLGLAVTGTTAWVAYRIDRSSEHRLLDVQTKQAALLLTTAITDVQAPLATALDIAAATGGSRTDFARFMSGYVSANGAFLSAALWRVEAGSAHLVAAVGARPALAPGTPPAQELVLRATRASTFLVEPVTVGSQARIVYAFALPAARPYVVSAERAIPPGRRTAVESNSAFSELHFATYLGPTTSSSALTTTDIAPNRLPLTGITDRVSIPFGNSSITLVTSPRGHLGGALSGVLPWILLAGGTLITIAAALIAGRLARRRRDAESDSVTIAGLYRKLDDLYREQRSISETLQHALLPRTNPEIPGVDTVTRYVAGANGVDVGGDWYSVVRLDETHFAFVIGDVSGRGVGAASVMARIRFTLRAYLLEGHQPEYALAMCAQQSDISVDEHFATALVGIVDLVAGTITIANAGHLNPLLVSGAEAHYLRTEVGEPLGVAQDATYTPVTVAWAPGSTLFAFTDGLVERRSEALDRSLNRLAAIVAGAFAGDSEPPQLETALSSVLAKIEDDGDDDVAILAIRLNSLSTPAMATDDRVLNMTGIGSED